MYNYSEEEQKILKFWEENKIFEKSLEKNKKRKAFVFYDGPPFATGTPHYGHLLQSVVKDVIPRYKTMQGFYVERQWGFLHARTLAINPQIRHGVNTPN